MAIVTTMLCQSFIALAALCAVSVSASQQLATSPELVRLAEGTQSNYEKLHLTLIGKNHAHPPTHSPRTRTTPH